MRLSRGILPFMSAATCFCSYVVINGHKAGNKLRAAAKIPKVFWAWTRMRWISRDSALRGEYLIISSIVSSRLYDTGFCVSFRMKYTLTILLYSASIGRRAPAIEETFRISAGKPALLSLRSTPSNVCVPHGALFQALSVCHQLLDAVSRTMHLHQLHGWWCRLFSFHKWSITQCPRLGKSSLCFLNHNKISLIWVPVAAGE